MIENVATLFASSVDTATLSDKQKAVLKASLTLFADKGFDATSTHDIAAAAHVAEGTVYKVFKTKEGLLAAIMKPFIDQVLPTVVAQFVTAVGDQQLPDLRAALTFMVHDRLEFVMTSRREVKVFAEMVLRDPRVLATLAAKSQHLLDANSAKLILPLQQAGMLVDWPALRILRYIAGTVLSYVLPVILMDQPALDVDAVTAECVEFLLKGLAA